MATPLFPSQKGGRAPKFSAHVYCGQTAGWMKLVLGMEVGLSPGDFVLDGDPVHFPQKRAEPPPLFSAHFYCGQTAVCIKMPLGMELGLTPGDFALDRDPGPTPLKRHSPQLSVRLLWPKGWMDENATWYGSRRRPRPHCVTQGPSSPAKGTQQSPPLTSAYVYCGHGRPSQLLLSSC